MNRLRFAAALGALVMLAWAESHVHAAFHLWDIKEVYTNHDGSVQFIELFTTSGFEQFVSGQQIRATSDGVVKTFTFGSNISGSTANRHLLIATPGFGSLTGGVAANYSLPNPLPSPDVVDPFFNPNATSITINFLFADAPLTFAGSLLPKDGVNSLTDTNPNGTPNLVVGVNSPTNFAGASGSVNLPPPPPPPSGDYNGNGIVDAADYTTWRDTLGQSVAMDGDGADGDESGMIDAGDYTYWVERFGNVVPEGGPAISGATAGLSGSANSTVPEPATLMFWWWGLAAAMTARRPRVETGRSRQRVATPA